MSSLKDWPKIPQVEAEYNATTGHIIVLPIDLGALGEWGGPELKFEGEELPTDQELTDIRKELQDAFERVILKAAAIILIKREDYCAEAMKEWIEVRLDAVRHALKFDEQMKEQMPI